MPDSFTVVENAYSENLAVPAFNIPHLEMMEPVIAAVRDEDAFAFVEVARLEWTKMSAIGLSEVAREFFKHEDPGHVRLHLDHIPVIDEDDCEVDWQPIFQEAIEAGFQSLMIDGSRLDLEGNIEKTSLAVEMAHHADLPCEAELGAVFGHEDGPRPSYEELFSSGRGFTNVEQARRFVNETGCDWLSVAVGTVHGAISGTDKDRKKVEARIDLDHLAKLAEATGIPLVLHGGSSVNQEYVLEAMKLGIAKINIATEIRQAYEFTLRDTDDTQAAQKSVYDRTGQLLSDYLGLSGTRHRVVQ